MASCEAASGGVDVLAADRALHSFRPLGSGNFTVSSMPSILRTDTAPSALMRSITSLHQHFGRRGAGREADARLAFQPFAAAARRRCPPCSCPRRACAPVRARRLLLELVGLPTTITTSTCARHDLHRVLPVLRGVADVLLLGLADVGKALPHGRRDLAPHRPPTGGLRHHGELARSARAARCATSATSSTRWMPWSSWPMVPSTSGWPLWPIMMNS